MPVRKEKIEFKIFSPSINLKVNGTEVNEYRVTFSK